MSFSPTLGRWITRDPAGYIDGPNLYQAFAGNPGIHVDPLGLYKVKFGGGFTLAEQARIRASFDRVRARLDDLLFEVYTELRIEKCQSVVEKLEGLKDLIVAVRADLDPEPRGTTIVVTLGEWGNPDATMRHVPALGGIDIQINAKARQPWTNMGRDKLDELLFHELTHEHGTLDETLDDFNNAHALEKLMTRPLEKWTALQHFRLRAKCTCDPPTSQSSPKPATQPSETQTGQ